MESGKSGGHKTEMEVEEVFSLVYTHILVSKIVYKLCELELVPTLLPVI